MRDQDYYLRKESVRGSDPRRMTIEFWEKDKSYRFLVSKRRFLRSPIADFGCGSGPLTILTARLGFEITGFDCIGENIVNGTALAESGDTVHFVHSFLGNIPVPDQTFASGICKEVLEHIVAPDIPPVIEEMKRVMKPGAPIIFTVPRESLLKPCDPVQHVTFFHSPGELARYLKKFGFRIAVKEYNRLYHRICVIAMTPSS